MAKQTQQLDAAIDDYLRFRRSMDLSKNTLRQDASTLKGFLTVVGNIWVHSISDLHVTRFFEEAAKTRQPQSLRNDYTKLDGFFDWARRTRRMRSDNDPLYGRRKPKRVTRERNRIHVSKFNALLDAAERRSPRDRMAVAALLYTLARDGEIATLRIRDVDLEGNYLKVLVHKVGVEDRVPICEELEQEIRRWLTVYTQDVGHLEPHYYLVPARDTKGVRGADGLIERVEHVRYAPERKIQALGKVVRPALDDIGFQVKDEKGRGVGEGAHTIRRSGARALFDQLVRHSYDGALRIVQSLLHHSSVQTTEIYLGITADKKSRDDLIRGKRLYDYGTNVTELKRAGTHGEDEDRAASM